ncbi:MAG TPA: hypothetical protein VM285_01640 [Polyangia bacterium]|nr:hypothetical protein [Polyangia bacterium]
MRRLTTMCLALGFGLALTVVAAPAVANKLDLSLARFVECRSPSHCEPQIALYEQFLAEWAFALAPKTMGPASTLGYSGFYLGLEGTLTPVPEDGNSDDRRWYTGTTPINESPGLMFVPSVRIRKGLPWSMELGGSINYLAQSEAVALGGEVKWSIFEGYRHGFRGVLPDVAARGTVSRVLGQGEIDMTIIGVDGAISYPFGIGGMISLTPFAGFQYLWTIIRVEPMTYRDENGVDNDNCGADGDDNCWATQVDPDGSQEGEFHTNEGGFYDISGLSGPNLERMRLFLGFQLKYEMLSFMFEAAWGLAKKWDTAVDDRDAFYPADQGVILDESQLEAEVDHQVQFTGGVGLQF